MKKQTLLLIGLGVVLIAMAKKKPNQKEAEEMKNNWKGFNPFLKSKNSVIVHPLEGGHIQTVFESLFNKKPNQAEANEIKNNWKNFKLF